MDKRPKTQIDATERADIFHDTFDSEIDAGTTLAALVRSTGDYLARIVGPSVADAAMEKLIGVFGWHPSPDGWRQTLEENESYCFSEWPLGQRLHDLAAYAHFGIDLGAKKGETEAQVAERLEHQVTEADRFVQLSPMQEWLGTDGSGNLENLVMLALNRWALDNDLAIEPGAVAIFGGISEGRVKNMMSGAKRTFSNDGGKIPAQEALAWLAGRPDFWNSIWREQRLPGYGQRGRAPLEDPVFVPVARDGSVFHAGLHRGSGYTVGAKGSEIQVDSFSEALLDLQRMPVPHWRRPNDAGNWGLVSGVRWVRLDGDDLQMFADDPSRRLTNDVPV